MSAALQAKAKELARLKKLDAEPKTNKSPANTTPAGSSSLEKPSSKVKRKKKDEKKGNNGSPEKLPALKKRKVDTEPTVLEVAEAHDELQMCGKQYEALSAFAKDFVNTADGFRAYSVHLLKGLNTGRSIPLLSAADFKHEDWSQTINQLNAGASIGEVNKTFVTIRNAILLDLSRVVDRVYLELAHLYDILCDGLAELRVVSFADDDDDDSKVAMQKDRVRSKLRIFEGKIIALTLRLANAAMEISNEMEQFQKNTIAAKGKSSTRRKLSKLSAAGKLECVKGMIKESFAMTIHSVGAEEYQGRWKEIRYGLSYVFLEGTTMLKLIQDTKLLATRLNGFSDSLFDESI